jgi:hypothetical protein
MRRQRALEPYKVSLAGSKDAVQPGQGEPPPPPARESASEPSRLLRRDSMLQAEGEDP